MNTINVTDFNEFLQNKSKYVHEKQKGYQGVSSYNNDGVQGEYDEEIIIYKHISFPENLYYQETYETDSYGYNPILSASKFVKGIEKQIVGYEAI